MPGGVNAPFGGSPDALWGLVVTVPTAHGGACFDHASFGLRPFEAAIGSEIFRGWERSIAQREAGGGKKCRNRAFARCAACIALALLGLWSAPTVLAHAAQDSLTAMLAGAASAVPVDDTGTMVLDPSLALQWAPHRSQSGSTIVSASTQVNVQLNLANWQGRHARIYMVLTRGSGATVRASWTSGGRLLPGALLSGERALVYAGAITTPTLRDVLLIQLEADSRRLVQPQALSFAFEIEVNP